MYEPNDSTIVYKSMISNDLCHDILEYYLSVNDISSDNGSVYFPKRRVLKYLLDTHTCLIYLTDDFYGGNLSVKVPRSQTHINQFDEPEKKHLTVTVEPRQSYGLIFPKNYVHFNDELLGGDKIILLVDCEIIY